VSRKYAMERAFLERLRADRRELFAFARAVGNAAEMRAARDDLMKSATVYLAPKAGEAVKYEVRDGVAHIPVVGQLTPSADPCGAFTGQAETEYGYIQAALIAAEDDPSVREIALDVNSPGGYISGLDETAQVLGMVGKPTTAYVGSMAASAAYWFASQADRIVALSPASEIGSIGVAMEEYDDDAALAAEGIAHRVYTSTDAPDKRPDTKTEEGRGKIVAELDALHGVFVRRVADGRKVSEEKVNKEFGRGGVLIGEAALAVGMIDEVRGSHITRNQENTGVAGNKPAGAKDTKGVKNMTIEQIKAEAPDAAAALRDEGIQAERKRVAGLSAWKGINADADKAVEEAIAAGKSYEDVASQLAASVAKGNSREANGENAETVATDTAKNGANATAPVSVAGMSADDIAKLKAFGMSDDEIRAYAPGKGE
jgi:capsid assembly protease